jgi:hypothetical protein
VAKSSGQELREARKKVTFALFAEEDDRDGSFSSPVARGLLFHWPHHEKEPSFVIRPSHGWLPGKRAPRQARLGE